MKDRFLALLSALGVTVPEGDPLIDMVLEDVTWHLKNRTNLTELPDGLTPLALRLALGRYLQLRKDTGTLEASSLDLTGPVARLQMGDTTVDFASDATPDARLDALIAALSAEADREIFRYRRLRW